MFGRKQARTKTGDGLPTFRGKPLFADSMTFAVTRIEASFSGTLISPPSVDGKGRERSWFLIGFTDSTAMWGSFDVPEQPDPPKKRVFDPGDDV